MPINEYEQTQNIDLDKIFCNKCNAKKSNTYENKMYLCNICKIRLCPLCQSKHDKSHNAINYDFKHSTCEKHNELYNSYCKDCKTNICVKCQKNHIQHDVIQFGMIFPDKDELLKALKEFRKIIELFNKDIDKIIERFNKVKENIERIYKIDYEMVTKYEDKNRNYQAFMSLNSIKNNIVMKNLSNINQVNNIIDKSKYILNIYDQMFQQNLQNMINKNFVPKATIKKKIFSNDKTNSNNISIAEYNLNSQRNVKKIMEDFNYPPLIGLDNLGNSSYMNATLQCFCNIDKFVNYFKYNKELIEFVKKDARKEILSSSFKLLIENLWPDKFSINNTKNKSYTPKEFKNKLSLLNNVSVEPKDLIKFIINELHLELNKAEKISSNNKIDIRDKMNKKLMFYLFGQDFRNNDRSIISDLFFGANYNCIQCFCCKCTFYNYYKYFYFDFPLEKIRIFKNQHLVQNDFNTNNNEINLYDCFSYDQREILYRGEDQIFCPICNKLFDHKGISMLSTGPEILLYFTKKIKIILVHF